MKVRRKYGTDFMEQSKSMGTWAFVPAAVGFWFGVLFLLILDRAVPHLHMNSSKAEGPKSSLQKTTMLVLAVMLHNLPEGMAVGVVYAGLPRKPTSGIIRSGGFSWGLAWTRKRRRQMPARWSIFLLLWSGKAEKYLILLQ